jgi:single-strand DNA-binding protein
MALNKVLIIGNVGRDVELRYTPSGAAVATFTVAVNRRWKDKDSDEWKEEVEWFSCVVWNALAERIAEQIRKGNKVYCEGRMQTQKWEQDGQTKYRTQIVCHTVLNLERKPPAEGGPSRHTGEGFDTSQYEADLNGYE